MAAKVKPIPAGYSSVTPHLTVRDAGAAIEFYKKAFGAVEKSKDYYADGKTIMHAEITIGKAIVMLTDEMPQMKYWLSPSSLHGTTVGLHIYTEDVDAMYRSAVEAGATPSIAPMDAFWGDRYGRVTDPFGHEWSIATRTRNLTPEEVRRGAEEFFARTTKAPVG